ncbi:hypothetical protein OOU_Y34scaffold01179g3 [Pyricularia oryzae Y34]|uniref:Uncharacterized protein n=1 Tax=Pyricularia oryzae (strain Y34) TaxID=1143189 RepID=A0AA97PF69_PYRO3|nr:hypothetical protein OOU_Y34scaffold01179g3 [Pyricularia oryzae Y34]
MASYTLLHEQQPYSPLDSRVVILSGDTGEFAARSIIAASCSRAFRFSMHWSQSIRTSSHCALNWKFPSPSGRKANKCMESVPDKSFIMGGAVYLTGVRRAEITIPRIEDVCPPIPGTYATVGIRDGPGAIRSSLSSSSIPERHATATFTVSSRRNRD